MAGTALADPALIPCLRLGRWRECASVPMADTDSDAQAKAFPDAAPDKARLYLVRPYTIRPRHLSTVVIDGETIGDLAPVTYLMIELEPGVRRIEVRNGDQASGIDINVEPGKTLFVEDHISLWFDSVRTQLRAVSEEHGKRLVSRSGRAKSTRDGQ